ncbi:MAG TPA: TolC family protein, partial [Paraburkholderia sp.]
LQRHPRLLAARASLDATEASLRSIRAQTLPSIRIEASVSSSSRPIASGGAAGNPVSSVHSRYVGLRMNIPLFEGFGATYRIGEARAQMEVQQAEVAETERQVALSVWKSYQLVRAGALTGQRTAALLDNATLAFDAAQARYKAGVASIVELLRAQDSLVDARQQRIVALSDWFVARLSLAASLGKLDFDAPRDN